MTMPSPTSETHYQRLARERTALHDQVGRNNRQILDNRDYIGVIAEGEFARFMGYTMNQDLVAAGDGGCDFVIQRNGYRVDVKATERIDGRLMVPLPLHAQIYVLAIVDCETETAIFPGWAWAGDFAGAPERHYDRWFMVRDQKDLRPLVRP